MGNSKKTARRPITIDFSEPISDDLYVTLATTIMSVLDLAGSRGEVIATMTIDPDLDTAYDEVDPFGARRHKIARARNAR